MTARRGPPTCGDDGGKKKNKEPCGATTNPPTRTRCRRHPRGATPEQLAEIAREMGREGGLAAMRARLVPERVSLRTPDEQLAVVERAVAGLLSGGQNARAAAAAIDGVRVAARVVELGDLDKRLKALERGAK